MSHHNIVFIQSSSESVFLGRVQKTVRKAGGFHSQEAVSFAEASKLLQSNWSGLVILVANNKDELLGTIHFLSANAKLIRREKRVRVMLFTSSRSERVHGILSGLGCSDILGLQIGRRALLFKIQRHFELLAKTDFSTETAVSISQDPPAPEELYGFGLGVKAFEPTGLEVSVDASPATILESFEKKIRVQVAIDQFTSHHTVLLEIKTQNLKPAGSLSASCRILDLEWPRDSRWGTLELALDADALRDWNKIQAGVEERQENILKFLKQAKAS